MVQNAKYGLRCKLELIELAIGFVSQDWNGYYDRITTPQCHGSSGETNYWSQGDNYRI